MRRHHIIVGVVVVALAGALLGVYQFYFKEKLQAYSQDLARKEHLVTKLNSLADTFSDTQPDVIVDIWDGAVNPWRDAVKDRASFFTVDEVLEMGDIPEEGILKFYYEEQLAQRLTDLRQEAFNLQIPIPLTTFGAPTAESLRNTAPNGFEVLSWLRKVERGCAVTRMLLKARPLSISRMELWPPYKHRLVLTCHTVGVEWRITLENLLAFLDDAAQDDDRFCTVNEIQIRNRQLQSYQDPPLEVALIFTQAEYVEPTERDRLALASLAVTSVGSADAQEQFARLRMSRGTEGGRRTRKRKSWFRKYFWPFDWP